MRAQPAVSQRKAEVKMVNGRAMLVVDGEPLPPMAYTSAFRVTAGQAERLAAAGVQVYFVWLDSGWHDTTSWQEAGAEAARILAANPKAYLILRVACHPSLAWLDEHPEECETFEDGRTDYFRDANQGYENWYPRMVCLASCKFAETAGAYLRKLVDFVEASSFGERVIGYFLVGGGTGEWYYPMAYEGIDKHCFGFSPAFKRFYAQWLRNKYGSDEGLQRAWNDPIASLGNPRIPQREERLLYSFEFPADFYPHEGRLFLKGDWGTFLDPSKNQFLADFSEGRTAGTAATIEHLARAVKERTDGRAIVGAFWGNLGCTYYHLGSVSGPLFLANSPWMDFFSSPSNYEDRVPGGGATFRMPVDSLAIRGKLWFNESDSRTFRAPYPDLVGFGGTYTLEESLNALKRDFAQVLCDDAQAFWFDQQEEANALYDCPEIMALIRQQQALSREYYDCGRRKVSQIAVVYDQDSLWYVDQETSKDLVWLNRTFTIPRIGAPCDHIFHDDFDLAILPEYRMYIFVNCVFLSDSDRNRINQVVKRDGKTVVWVYAPGLINPARPTQLSLDHMEELTGFRFGAEQAVREATFRIGDENHELTRGLSRHVLYGRFERPMMNYFNWKRGEIRIVHPSLSSPLIYVQDPEAEALGRYVCNDQVAFAVKNFRDWRSIYVGCKALNPAILRTIGQAAGVHLYLETDDIVYANRRFLAIHATVEDTKHIHLPHRYKRVTDAYTSQIVACDTDAISVQMHNGETRMFRLE